MLALSEITASSSLSGLLDIMPVVALTAMDISAASALSDYINSNSAQFEIIKNYYSPTGIANTNDYITTNSEYQISKFERVQSLSEATNLSLAAAYYFDVSKDASFYKFNQLNNTNFTFITDVTSIQESLLNILNTEKGEMVMNQNFGTSLKKYLFEPVNVINGNLLLRDIENAIKDNEPRLTNVVITIQLDPDNNLYIINITADEISASVNASQKAIDLTIDFKKLRQG